MIILGWAMIVIATARILVEPVLSQRTAADRVLSMARALVIIALSGRVIGAW